MASASLAPVSGADKENSRPTLGSPKASLRSPAKGPLADVVNMPFSPLKDKGASKPPQSIPVPNSKGTPVKCLSTCWLERYHAAQEQMQNATTPPLHPTTPEPRVIAPATVLEPTTTSGSWSAAPPAAAVDPTQEAKPAPHLGESLPMSPGAPLPNTPVGQAAPAPGGSSGVVVAPEVQPLPTPVSFPLSPKAKPFLPKASPPLSTPLSPKAKPFFPRSLGTPPSPQPKLFHPGRWALFQNPCSPYDPTESPVHEPHHPPSFTSLTSPVVPPLSQPLLMSPFTPSSLPVSLPATASSNSLFAPTCEQAKAKQLTRLEALWVRRCTPVKAGERPLSPTGNVLTSPETWDAVNWWSPSNKPLRHSAVQADVAASEAKGAATEGAASPKMLFSEPDSAAEVGRRAPAADHPNADHDGSAVASETMTDTGSAVQDAEAMTSVAPTNPTAAQLPQGQRGHLAWRTVLRLKRAVKSRTRAARCLARLVRREALAHSSWPSAWSSVGDLQANNSCSPQPGSLGDELGESMVVPRLLMACMAAEPQITASPCGEPSPCLSDASLQTAFSADNAASSPIAPATLPAMQATRPTPIDSLATSSEGRCHRIVIRVPRSERAGRDHEASPSTASVQIIAGGVTIDIIHE